MTDTERNEGPENQREAESEEVILEEPSGSDTLKLFLALPALIHPESTSTYLPSGSSIMNEILESFGSDPSTMNRVMSQLTAWTGFYVNEPNWITMACSVESDAYLQCTKLADQMAPLETRFGDMPPIEAGDVTTENKQFIENNSLDLILSRAQMGPCYAAISIMRYTRSRAVEDQAFKRQYGYLVAQCLLAHETNIRITLNKLGASAAMREYRALVSKSKKLTYQPTEDELDVFNSDLSRLLDLDIIFTVSLGQPRVAVRLMARALETKQATEATVDEGEAESGAEDEPASTESVGSRTRSKSQRSILSRLDTLEKEVKDLKSGLNTLVPPRHASSGCSESSQGSRKRSRSPVIRGRNFQKQPPRKRPAQPTGRFTRR